MIRSFARTLLNNTVNSAVQTINNKKFDPLAVVKATVNSFKVNYEVSEKYNNNVALTPPMGWSSWNLFRNKIDENLIYETAKAIKESGLLDCGYLYVNIDDCWQSSMRDENGRLQGDFGTFPSGIKSLVDKVNALGLKLGIYSSNGTHTCEDLPASLYNEAIDADTFAEWGIEYFKYDFCHNIPLPVTAPDFDRITLKRTGDKFEYSFCVDEAILSGNAQLMADDKMTSGIYLTGLSSNGGACEFNRVEVSESGEYILTICMKKINAGDKYLEVQVNGDRIYSVLVPPTKNFTKEGRHQIKIFLEQGINSLKIYNPVASSFDSAAIQYTNMGKELKRATKEYAQKNGVEEKPIVYSICEWGFNRPFVWGKQAGNLWRTTGDIKPYWYSVLGIYEFNVLLYKNAGPGGWNDPDMLEVGNGTLNYEENKSHFTLWCMMAAPLMLGNDVRDFINSDGTVDTEHPTFQIVSNKELIAIDQDPLGIQCRRIKTNGAEDILVKPLINDEFAVCFFNKAKTSTRMFCSIQDIISQSFVTTPYSEHYQVRELWDNKEVIVNNVIQADVPGHGVKIFKVKKA